MCLALSLAANAEEADATPGDWPQWRGPQRSGLAPDATWPASLDALKRQWRVELGKGYPGPIVSGDRVFVVETADSKTIAVRALDRNTGEQHWRYDWSGSAKVPFFASRNGSWVRSTPAYDGKTLYVGDMKELLFALDGATGEPRWSVDIPARYETKPPDFGFASSPMVLGDYLIVQAANSLLKLDKSTGETVWRVLEHSGEMSASGAFSSPTLATIHGKSQLLVQTRHTLYGIDPDSGETLWSHDVPSFRGMNILTPTVHGNSIFTSTHRNNSFFYEIGATDSSESAELKWSNEAQGYMSSPVVIGDHVYLHMGNGRLTCIDLTDGEREWTSPSMGSYWSIAHSGETILGLGENGTLYLVRANPEKFELLGEREVSDQESWGHIAVAGDQIFIRELEGVSAWSW